MSPRTIILVAITMALFVVTSAANAKVTEQQASQLGQKLTPIGAKKAASKDGTIPAWTGKLSAPVNKIIKQSGYQSGGFYSRLFPDEKPQFKITHDNYKKYADHLTQGARQLLENYPDYYMNVYTTHRIQQYPKAIYKATRANAATATLSDDGETLNDAHLGFPFPIPGNGAQAIWNHLTRYRADSYHVAANQFVVSNSGHQTHSKSLIDVKFIYGNVKHPGTLSQNLLFRFLAHTVAPPRLAGTQTLVYDHMHGPRSAWQYNPGLHRIIRAPNIGFDHPVGQTDGMQFDDQVDMFNGSLKLYSWKLLGKKAMYIPYDAYLINRPNLKYEQILKTHHPDPQYQRFELHRVWIVQATLKKDARHQFSKRTFYIDEDSWTIAAVDCYDNEGNLWRYQQSSLMPMPVEKTNIIGPLFIYDFLSGRYLAVRMSNEDKHPIEMNVSFPPNYFAPRNVANRAR